MSANGDGQEPREPEVGPAPEAKPGFRPYHHPAAGWGAAKSVSRFLVREGALVDGPRAIMRMNHENTGFDCPGCAWPDDTKGLHLDICENGIKHVTWEMTRKRVGREFFAAHSVTELAGWSDYDLENQGRLTEPMAYDPESDHYVPISWKDAFELVGRALRELDSPNQAAFYTSGRLGNEATFLYQLMARELGTNNLPDCSNMCHEASGRALNASLGTGKGTVDLKDWESADALFILGVNAASNAPRMLTALADAHHRGAQIVHVNPLVEAAATRAIVPHDFVDMALFKPTRTSTLNLQPRIGGDMALLRGMAKAVLEQSTTDPKALDQEFIDRHTAGFDEYRALCEETPWEEIETQSGLSRTDILKAARVYREADRSIVSWCLGLTQHEHGVDTVREIVNLLLLRGNLGREGAGPSPYEGTATSRATAPAASTTGPPTPSWTASVRCAASSRPVSTVWTPSAPSRRCTAARCRCSSAWAATSPLPHLTPRTPTRRCAPATSPSRSAPSSTAATSSTAAEPSSSRVSAVPRRTISARGSRARPSRTR